MKYSFYRFSISFILLLSAYLTQAQTVYTDPEFPTADAPVTVFFNAEGTPLEGYNGDLYTHTGVTVNGNQWQYVIGEWGNNSNQPQLTKIGSNLYELEMTPSIRNFYGVPSGDEITEMSFVFRAESGSPQSSDLFVDVFSDELSLVIQQPATNGFLIEQTDSIEVKATSPLADSIFIYIGDDQISAVAGITIQDTIPAILLGDVWTEQWITVKARNETDEVEMSFPVTPIPTSPVAELPAGMIDGINYLDGSTVILSLYAPLKKFAFVIGEFNSWEAGENSYMNRTPEGDRYWFQVNDLGPGQEYTYQYFVDGAIKVSDPYSKTILDPWNDQYIPEETYPNLKPYPAGQEGPVTLLQTNQEEYVWQNTNFEPPAVTDLVVYELLIRDFIDKQNYQTLIDTMNYLKTLGINAIELMPVNEFDGNNSWGYNPNHFLAVDKIYGTKNALKEFIDVCHGQGIAVILDVVYNHATNLSPYIKLYWNQENARPSEDSPFYNEEPKHDFNVFNDMNHESDATREYISRAVKFWLDEFKVDGYRFDLSKGFTQKNTLGNPGAMAQYDQDRIDILTAYADSAWTVNPDAYVILEHFADNTEEKVLSNHGCMIWGNSNHNYNEGTMGYNADGKSDFSWISYQKRGWNDPHVMGYMESHDEERLVAKTLEYGNSSGSYNTKNLTTALERQQLAAAFFFTIPGPKQIWQFGELGYDVHINYPGEIGGGDHRTDPKPIKWEYTDDFRRKVLYNVYRELIHLKMTEPAFRTTDFSISVGGAMKKIHLNHATMNVAVIGNFDVEAQEINPQFQHTGYWYDYFAGDSIHVTDVNENITLNAGEYRIYTDVKFARPEIGLSVDDHKTNVFGSLQLYPNPSDGAITITFELKEKSKVNIGIFNIDGQLIKSMNEAVFPVGEHTVQWDGISITGEKVNSGIYFCELINDSGRVVEKLVIY